MKLGVIGLGLRMSSMVREFAKEDPDFSLVGVVDENLETALSRLPEEWKDRVRVFADIHALMREAAPDALAIGTRCDSHARLACEVARYEVPLYLEKPIATNLEDAVRLETAFANNPDRVLVSFPLRASYLCRAVRARLEGGAVGRAEHILAVNYVPYGDVYFKDWYRDYQVTQGLLLQKATHDFDYISYLMGSPVARAVASLSRGRVYRDVRSIQGGVRDASCFYGENIGLPEEGCNEDAANVLLEFESGAIGVYTQVFYSKRKAGRRGARVSGWEGTLHFDWADSQLEIVKHHEPAVETVVFDNKEGHFGGDSGLARNFVAMVKEGAKPLASIRVGLQSVYTCLAAKQSVEEKRFVDVRKLTEG